MARPQEMIDKIIQANMASVDFQRMAQVGYAAGTSMVRVSCVKGAMKTELISQERILEPRDKE